MPASLAIEESRPKRYAIVRGVPTALCRTWAGHTVRRAIADVSATSEQDYQEFGLNKAEMLAALELLRDELEGTPATEAVHTGHGVNNPRLAIVVTRRDARRLSCAGALSTGRTAVDGAAVLARNGRGTGRAKDDLEHLLAILKVRLEPGAAAGAARYGEQDWASPGERKRVQRAR
jgi:hypothetical protein